MHPASPPLRRLFLLGLCVAGALPAASVSVPIKSVAPKAGPNGVAQAPVMPGSILPDPVPPSFERFREGQFQWARLHTSGPYWNRHAGGDPALIDYLRRATPLKIDPEGHTVRPDSVEALEVFPLIYCDSVASLSPPEAANLAEYLRRGGFLCIDACEHRAINPFIPAFLETQLRVLTAQLPDLRTEELFPKDELFSIYFKFQGGPPYRKSKGEIHPTYALYDGDRLIGLIGLNGMQCGWSDSSAGFYSTECAQMMANIVIYAMTR